MKKTNIQQRMPVLCTFPNVFYVWLWIGSSIRPALLPGASKSLPGLGEALFFFRFLIFFFFLFPF
jgi:hypothetical protein